LDRGLWITWYDLTAEGRDAYLSWLHGSYIPRLLKKPGFLWAAHYASEKQFFKGGMQGRMRHTDDATVPTGTAYILLFGAEDAHAFAHPIPAKLHAELPREDQEMLSMRIGERVNIFTEEARTDGPKAHRRAGNMALSPCIQIGSFNTGAYQDEEEMLDWYANWRMPSMRKLAGCLGARKLVSVAGWGKHGVLYEFLSLEARNKNFPNHESSNPAMNAWSDRLVRKLVHAPGSLNPACRIWPPVQ
jgi:hypothetical protein